MNAAHHGIKHDLTQGNLTGHLWRQSIPMLIGLGVLLGTQLLNTVFVGRLGEMPLAVLGLSLPIYMVAYNIVFAVSISTGSLVSRAVGAKEGHRAAGYITAGLVVISIAGILEYAIGIATIDWLFPMLGATPDMMPTVHSFMHIWYLLTLVLGLSIVGNAGLRGLGNARIASMVMVVVALVGLVLDVLLIFGYLGAPRLGLNGAAVSMVVSYGVAGAVCLGVLNKHRYITPCRSLAHIRELLTEMRDVILLTGPTLLANLLVPLAGLVTMGLVGKYGAAAVAGFGTGLRIEALLLTILMAITAALSPLVGQNFGAQNMERTRISILTAGKILGRFYAVTAVALLIGAHFGLAKAFSPTPDTATVLKLFFSIAPFAYIGMVGTSIATSALNASGKPKIALYLNVAKFACLQIPCAYILQHFMGLPGVFIGLLVGQYLASGISIMVLRRTFWHHGS